MRPALDAMQQWPASMWAVYDCIYTTLLLLIIQKLLPQVAQPARMQQINVGDEEDDAPLHAAEGDAGVGQVQPSSPRTMVAALAQESGRTGRDSIEVAMEYIAGWVIQSLAHATGDHLIATRLNPTAGAMPSRQPSIAMLIDHTDMTSRSGRLR